MKGFTAYLTSVVVFGCVFYGLTTLLSGSDDTDPPDGHSGMELYHDQLTGCEYLARMFGALTPRLDANGKQICRKGGPE